MSNIDETTAAGLEKCWDVLRNSAGAEERRAYEWRVMDKQLKKWVLIRAGFDPDFFGKPIHTWSVSDRLKIRRSIELTIKKLESVKAVMCYM